MKRNAQGAGTIRQRNDGRWEARYTAGYNSGTGKQIQKSIYGATQKEVLEKLRQIQTAVDNGTYVEPLKLTLGAWLDAWTRDYLGGVKESTQAKYKSSVRVHIKAALGAVNLQKLKPHQIQGFYNSLQEAGMSAKSIRDIGGILHSALQQAVKNGFIKTNPAEACTLPRWQKKEMQVIDDDTAILFLEAIAGDRYEDVFFVDLFTGLRQAEVLGLTWGCVDFENGTLQISKQLVKERKKGGAFYLDTPKSNKTRKIKPAQIVMDRLKARYYKQAENKLKAGTAWNNPMDLVFTDEIGGYFVHGTVYKHYKRIVEQIGQPSLRFHDMRHSYAVMALMNGDDIKTVQSTLGHYTAAFTLDTYAHFTEKMRDESAARMNARIEQLNKLKKG